MLNILTVITALGIFFYCFVSFYKKKYDDRHIRAFEEFNAKHGTEIPELPEFHRYATTNTGHEFVNEYYEYIDKVHAINKKAKEGKDDVEDLDEIHQRTQVWPHLDSQADMLTAENSRNIDSPQKGLEVLPASAAQPKRRGFLQVQREGPGARGPRVNGQATLALPAIRPQNGRAAPRKFWNPQNSQLLSKFESQASLGTVDELPDRADLLDPSTAPLGASHLELTMPAVPGDLGATRPAVLNLDDNIDDMLASIRLTQRTGRSEAQSGVHNTVSLS